MGMYCCCLHVIYIVYKHFDKSPHVVSLDPSFAQYFRPRPSMVFEILVFKLKNENDNKKNWRNEIFLSYLPC